MVGRRHAGGQKCARRHPSNPAADSSGHCAGFYTPTPSENKPPPTPLLSPLCILCCCRAIDRAGGLDRYLLKTPDSLLHSDKASDLKFRLSCIYGHKQHEEQQQHRQKQKQLEPPPPPQQQHQLHAGQSQLAAVQAARQQQALAAGGTTLGANRSWSSQAGSLLPPAAAAAGARD